MNLIHHNTATPCPSVPISYLCLFDPAIMISNALIKHIRSLHQAKFRDEYRQFIAEGVKVADELLKSAYKPVYLCASCNWITEYAHRYNLKGAEISTVGDEQLERISTMSTPNQVLVVFEKPKASDPPPAHADRFFILADALRDPGNLGTIIRIADWFGISDVICSEDTVDVYNPKTVQSAMGSLARVRVHYTPLDTYLKNQAADIPVMTACLEGENIFTSHLPSGGLIVIGSESHGISQEVAALATKKINIPSFNSGEHAESLNASVAAAIICGELHRRRL